MEFDIFFSEALEKSFQHFFTFDPAAQCYKSGGMFLEAPVAPAAAPRQVSRQGQILGGLVSLAATF